MLICYCGVEEAVQAIEKGPGIGGAAQQERLKMGPHRGWRVNALQGRYC